MHLSADMPPAKMGSRGQMELRIARKVAALCGIPGPAVESDDAGGGRAWLADYRQLTTTDLVLGGPVIRDADGPGGGLFHRPTTGAGRRFRHVDGDDVDHAPIPNAALQDYGPDTKAALVLTGVNRVLKPVTKAVRLALDDIRPQVDSPSFLVAVGLCLLQEVFAAQPVLFRNGVQAAQIQRAVLLPRPDPTRHNPHGRPLSRIEHPADPARYEPRHLEVIHCLWDSVAAREQYDERGRLHADDEAWLRSKQLSGFEQNDIVAATGRPHNRDWLVAMLEDLSEGLLTGALPGAPLATIRIEDPPSGPPFTEVVVPRQRQVELMVASMARRLAPLRLNDPIVKGQVLRLPVLRVDDWLGHDVLTRRAVLLAHYYSVRAAGWFAGMVKLDHRRSREDCAARCQDLIDAVTLLLAPDDPLRDQIAAYALGYLQQYEATFGRAGDYPALVETLRRWEKRVDGGGRGRAVVIELLPMVLDNLRSVRRAVASGVCDGPSERQLTADLQRWWGRARELRDELIHDPDERHHLDHGWVRALLDASSDDASLRRGLELMEKVTASRESSAQREGRWIALRMSYLAELDGLVEALRRWPDGDQGRRNAGRALTVARALTEHAETQAFLTQRVEPGQPGRASFDGAALQLLVTLTRGWLAVLRAGVLDERELGPARDDAETAVVDKLRGYLRALRGEPLPPPGGLAGSRLDPYRGRLADEALREWDAWARAGAGAAG